MLANNLRGLHRAENSRDNKSMDARLISFRDCVTGTQLDLNHKDINAEHVPVILDYLAHHPEIKKVNLSHNHLQSADLLALAKRMRHVTELDVSYNDMTAKDAKKMGAFARLNQSIKHLNLAGNKLEGKGAVAFVRNNKLVTHLNLSDNNIGPKSGGSLAQKNKIVVSLDLSKNKLADAGAKDFLAANKHITHLNLSDNKITEKDAKTLAQHNQTVRNLGLSKNPLGTRGVRRFVRWNTTATRLDLSETGMGPMGASWVARHNKTATELNMSGNKIDDKSIKYFAAQNKTAVSVDLSNNNLTNASAPSLKDNPVIARVNVSRNPMDAKTQAELKQYLAQHTASRQGWMRYGFLTAAEHANNTSAIRHSVLALIPGVMALCGSEVENEATGTQTQKFMNTRFFEEQTQREHVTTAASEGRVDPPQEQQTRCCVLQ